MKYAVLLITYALYTMLLMGIALCFYDSYLGVFRRISLGRGLAARRRIKKRNVCLLHIDLLLSALGIKKISAEQFAAFLLLIFTVTYALGIRAWGIVSGAAPALLTAAMPYLLLRIRLENLRKTIGFEGERLVSDILSEYRVSNMNIYEALERYAADSEKNRASARAVSTLLYKLRDAGDYSAAENACREFAFAVNTSWGRMLSYSILNAAQRGTDVSPSLEDLLVQLRQARTAAEERKRMNAEAGRLTVYFVPVLYLLTVLYSLRKLGLGMTDFIRNQFLSPTGFMLISVCVLLFFVNILLLELVNNKRFDY